MSEILEATVDKFTFKVATDRLYTDDRLWLKMADGLVSIGLTDCLQQSSMGPFTLNGTNSGDTSFQQQLRHLLANKCHPFSNTYSMTDVTQLRI